MLLETNFTKNTAVLGSQGIVVKYAAAIFFRTVDREGEGGGGVGGGREKKWRRERPATQTSFQKSSYMKMLVKMNDSASFSLFVSFRCV